jgi:hypothetical protein
MPAYAIHQHRGGRVRASLRSVVRDLNEVAHRTAWDRQWTSIAVREMLRGPRNAGLTAKAQSVSALHRAGHTRSSQSRADGCDLVGSSGGVYWVRGSLWVVRMARSVARWLSVSGGA